MSATRLLIVGAGVMGSVVGAYAKARGIEVLWFDKNEPQAGSLASAGVMIPEWSPLSQTEFDLALQVLESLYAPGVRSGERLGFGRPAWQLSRERWVRPSWMVLPHEVLRLTDRGLIARDSEGVEAEYRGKVLVTAGVWSGALVQGLEDLQAKAGTAFRVAGIYPPVLRTWAPYKQLMVFQETPTTAWAGDGTSILKANYTAARIGASRARCLGALLGVQHLGRVVTETTGYRPVIAGMKDGLSQRVNANTWVLTAGGKSSTILAGHYAPRILKEFL